ncbi:MAG: tRNA (adenosine(37)-N6)-threonylcarbamoyltransferase complex ATPase subunit type 1 TsaE [Burkholderiales bacterium]|nr:tRNA (adenosine(37)-N6)-threonylcarbamoyltransferase complex ATPase subunit type 1 TsaE [Bacteroidia bacterium]
MNSFKIDISNLKHHDDAAAQLIEFAGAERVFLFDAPMGAGKTTFIKTLCRRLHITDTMSSPTYSIVNEYHTNSNLKLFHFDLYRIKTAEELYELGFEEYVLSGNYVFIEWPELSLSFLSSYLRIIINSENNIRYLCAEIITNNEITN